jgi:hypothetical protein
MSDTNGPAGDEIATPVLAAQARAESLWKRLAGELVQIGNRHRGARPDTDFCETAALDWGAALEELEQQQCAAVVRAAGCLCLPLYSAEGTGDIEGLACTAKFSGETILEHDPRCPIALAAAIEAREGA